jgi:hypothetical protein
VLYIEEGQYVVLHKDRDGRETVYATCYGELQVSAAMDAVRSRYPGQSCRFGKASRVAAVRQEPWTLEAGEES